MRIRQGRHNARNLYIQMGDEPSDSDEYLAALIDPDRAAYIYLVMNGTYKSNEIPFEANGHLLLTAKPGERRLEGIVFDPERGKYMVSMLNGLTPALDPD